MIYWNSVDEVGDGDSNGIRTIGFDYILFAGTVRCVEFSVVCDKSDLKKISSDSHSFYCDHNTGF